MGYIEGSLGSRIWHVREIAAKTLCSFLLRGEPWLGVVDRLLAQAVHESNRLHGVLLTTRFVLERKAGLGEDLTEGECTPLAGLQESYAN